MNVEGDYLGRGRGPAEGWRGVKEGKRDDCDQSTLYTCMKMSS
jgi:hypothetical protein